MRTIASLKKGQVSATEERKTHLRNQKREFAKAKRKAAKAQAMGETVAATDGGSVGAPPGSV